MGRLSKATQVMVVAGFVLATFTLVAAADEVRGIKQATNIGQISSETHPTGITARTASAALFDCEPDQFPPCVDPPCDFLEMLNIWCASNEEDTTQAPNTTICAFDDFSFDNGEGGLKVVDDFFFLAQAEIQGLTWWGAMVQPVTGGFDDCDLTVAPAANDDWTITYYEDDNGVPGTVIKQFTNVNPSVASGTYSRVSLFPDRAINGVFGVFEMNYTFDVNERFIVNSFDRVWVEIVQNYTANDCFFCWEVATPNWNLDSLQANGNDAYDRTLDEDGDGEPDQVSTYDMAQCQDVCFNEAVPNPPGIELELFDFTPVDQEECCTFRYSVVNQNSPGAGPVTKFYMAVHRGDDDLPDCGEDLSEINPPPGYTVSYCEGWRLRQTGDSDWVIYQFDPTGGGEIPELGQVSGTLRVRVNDFKENDLQSDDPNDIVPAFGIRAWGSQRQDLGDQFCGGQAPGNFDPLAPVVGVDPWSDGSNGTCTNADDEPLRPIPSGTVMGKGLLAMLLIGAGLWLVIRSRRPVAA